MPDEKYPRLAKEKGIRAFPTLCFMDADGRVIGRPSRSLPAFTGMLGQAERLLALRTKGKDASKAEKRELFLTELDLDLVAADCIEPRAAKWSLSSAERGLVAEKPGWEGCVQGCRIDGYSGKKAPIAPW